MVLLQQVESRPFPIPWIDLPWVDQVALLFVVGFAVLGIVRGLWWQVVRLLGIVAAVALARAVSPRFTPSFQEYLPEVSDSVAHGIVWFVLFLGGLVVASLLGVIGKRALETMQLGLFDRVGGAFAGAMSGALLHSVALVVMIALAPAWSQRNVRGTHSAFLLDALVQKAHLLVDARAAERMRPVTETEEAPAGEPRARKARAGRRPDQAAGKH
jgi:uncharacterized membrane protein required for colicin V production